MNLKQLIDYIYYKPQSYYLSAMPYRQYIFEVKFKNIEDIAECKSPYCLSISYNTLLKELYDKGYIQVDDKQYSAKEIEYTRLIKIIPYYTYVFESCTDKILLSQYKTLEELIKRQKEYIPYAKYLKPKKLKKLINDSKIFYM